MACALLCQSLAVWLCPTLMQGSVDLAVKEEFSGIERLTIVINQVPEHNAAAFFMIGPTPIGAQIEVRPPRSGPKTSHSY